MYIEERALDTRSERRVREITALLPAPPTWAQLHAQLGADEYVAVQGGWGDAIVVEDKDHDWDGTTAHLPRPGVRYYALKRAYVEELKGTSR